MSEVPQNDGNSVVRTILMVIAGVFVIGSVIFMVQAQIRISDMEKRQAAAQQEILKKMTETNAQTHASINVLADRLGMTHKQLSKETSSLQA
jgi:Na+-translocating ferredoxin:NAD+ oxidoreductase RnfG subunit